MNPCAAGLNHVPVLVHSHVKRLSSTAHSPGLFETKHHNPFWQCDLRPNLPFSDVPILSQYGCASYVANRHERHTCVDERAGHKLMQLLLLRMNSAQTAHFRKT